MQLSGSIPTQVGQLTNLNHWEVDTNTLSGSLPTEIAKLTRLQFWRVFRTHLSGKIPSEIGDLHKLVVWDVRANRFSGTIPSQLGKLTKLQSCLLANNTLQGTLPSQLSMMAALVNFDAAANRLSGPLPDLSPTIEFITLHRNRLSGAIPSHFAHLTSLKVLSLFDNRLTGSVPELAMPSEFLLLFNNLLSCSLPSLESNVSQSDGGVSSPKTLVALGNRFQLDGLSDRINARHWLYKWDSESTHLFESYPRLWVRLIARLLCCILMVAVLKCIRRFYPPLPSQQAFEMVPAHAMMSTTQRNTSPPLWGRCGKVCLAMTGIGCVYMIALSLAHHTHDCLDPVDRVTLSEARFNLTETTFLIIVICALVHVVCSAAGVVWLSRRRSVDQPSRVRIEGRWSLLLLISWVLLILVLHVPVLFYLVSESFPSNNVFGMSQMAVTIVRGLVSPWFVFSGEWLIPNLSVWMAARYNHNRHRLWLSSEDFTIRLIPVPSLSLNGYATRQVRTSTDLILVSQLINLIVAPVISQLILRNRCFGVVTGAFWQPCKEPSRSLTIDVRIPPTGFVPGTTLRVLQQSEVCESKFEPELCQREVMASIATLSLSKVVLQTLFVLVRAMLLISLSKRRTTSKATTRLGRFRRWLLHRLTTPPTDESVTISIVSLLILGVALGGVAPLIWPAVLFCVYSTMLLWECSGQHHNDSPGLVGLGVVWFGIAVQVGFSFWFVFANMWGG
eukprot:c20241_g1_i2.p1 GENE.c20241_g1_i2~~c20241_g1_i2.p1  ORF type:complete len:730 (-),score=104.02 c20241_g1_i2:37-2226(-)